MKIIEDEGFCTACGKFTEFKYGEETFSFLKKDLNSYNKYKEIYVYQCPSCGFASTNITSEEGVLYGKIKDSYEYKQLLNYSYLKGLDKELYNNHSSKIAANLYEAYGLACLEQKNYEKFIRVTSKCIELKELMAFKYLRSKDELGGEEDNDADYEHLDELIKQSIKTNREQISYYFQFVEHKNVFIWLLFIENLIKMNNIALAGLELKELIKKYKLEKSLKDYFENLLIEE